MPDPTTTPAEAATTGSPAAALSALIGDDHAGNLIAGGAERLAEAFPTGIPRDTTAETIAGIVLAGAMSDFTRGEIEGGLLEGAEAAVRDAELGALADTLRAAFRAAKSTPDNPLEGLLAFADAAGVDLDSDQPAPALIDGPTDDAVEHLAVVIAEARLAGIRAGGYTLARVILASGYQRVPRASAEDLAILSHEQDGTTAYRLVVPGLVGGILAGVARISVHGDRWHAEQEVEGVTYAVDAEDELGAILALIAKQHGLAAVFGPDDGDRPAVSLAEQRDPVYGMIFNAITQAVARRQRFLSLSDRNAAASQTYQDLREAGAIK